MLLANLPALSNAQQVDTETGNIVYTTVNPAPTSAQGAYTWGGFTVTQSNGGGLSGGNQPAYNPSTGTFMFGYMQGTVSYGIAVNAALQAAGTGIQVNGFRYSWNYFNQDMSRGILTGNISLTNSSGAVVESYNYNMPKTTEGWTLMSGVQNFNTQYAPLSLGGLGVSFSGKDDRWWAGYYGPQIKDIDVRLLYSVNSQPPTEENPACTAYSTSSKCLAQNYAVSPTTTATTTTTSASYDTPTTSTTSSAVLPTTTGVSSPTTSAIETATATPTSSSTPATTSPTTTVAASTSTPPQSAPAKAGEVSDSGKSSQPAQSSVSLSTILSIVANEQSRIGNVERSVVQQAVEQAVKESEKTQKDAEKIAGTAQQQSIAASNQAAQQTHTTTVMQSTTIGASNAPAYATANILQPTTITAPLTPGLGTGLTFFSPSQTSGTGLSVSRFDSELSRIEAPVIVSAIPGITNRATSFDLATVSTRRVEEIELPKSEGFKIGDRNQVLNLIEEKPQTSQQNSSQPQSGPAVNQKVADNDAAGNISLASIAMQPRGYDAYFSALPDASFYAPKEIYRGQKTVDNARALRQLSSDRLHQQMVDQQFNGR